MLEARQAVDDITFQSCRGSSPTMSHPKRSHHCWPNAAGPSPSSAAEGGVFDIIAGRYNGNIPNMDVWLKGHSGDMIRVDRKGRPPEYIRKPAMTLGLMIQPEVLKSIAAQPAFRGRGLIARFLYAMPVSQVGYRKTGAAQFPRRHRPLQRHIRVWQGAWPRSPAIRRTEAHARRDDGDRDDRSGDRTRATRRWCAGQPARLGR